MKTTLVAVVSGEIYEKFTEDLFRSAEEFFHPTDEVECLMLYGAEGWPNATMHRPRFLARAFPDSDYVFLCDADMCFVAEVGPEVLPTSFGITATLHPGYVDVNRLDLPYERREYSSCYIPPDKGGRYYCGGFYGGGGAAMRNLCTKIDILIALDEGHGVIPVWHDETALNCVLADYKPDLILNPSMCYPEDDTWYKRFWQHKYIPKLVALDKTAAQRIGR